MNILYKSNRRNTVICGRSEFVDQLGVVYDYLYEIRRKIAKLFCDYLLRVTHEIIGAVRVNAIDFISKRKTLELSLIRIALSCI